MTIPAKQAQTEHETTVSESTDRPKTILVEQMALYSKGSVLSINPGFNRNARILVQE
jgi:hypothetical protein